MQFRKTIAVYSENNVKHISNTFYRKSTAILMLKQVVDVLTNIL